LKEIIRHSMDNTGRPGSHRFAHRRTMAADRFIEDRTGRSECRWVSDKCRSGLVELNRPRRGHRPAMQ
jgi:hypothetical protein